jgi:hypothetical protein
MKLVERVVPFDPTRRAAVGNSAPSSPWLVAFEQKLTRLRQTSPKYADFLQTHIDLLVDRFQNDARGGAR